MKVLKKSVHNTARPEGSIVEVYIVAKSIKLYGDNLPGLPNIGFPTGKNEVDEFDEDMLFGGKAMKGKLITADSIG